MKELEQLVEMSRYAGERFDLIQAGGGNTSVKLDDGSMLIKASGVLLSDLKVNSGYSKVVTQEVADVVNHTGVLALNDKRERETLANNLVSQATIDKANRPSIETLFHSLLQKYVLHTHPIVVNILTARHNWKDILDDLFPDAVKVPYYTPGIELVIRMKEELRAYSETHHQLPNRIFLQNHGLIVSSDNYSEIEKLNEDVLTKIETYLNVPPLPYKHTTAISRLLRQTIPDLDRIVMLSDDRVLNRSDKAFLDVGPFTPDILVFCGMAPLKLRSLTDTDSLVEYLNRYKSIPKIIVFEEFVFCVAASMKKAREIEEVLRFHAMVLDQNKEVTINLLEEAELKYLSDWDAEKYRQEI